MRAPASAAPRMLPPAPQNMSNARIMRQGRNSGEPEAGRPRRYAARATARCWRASSTTDDGFGERCDRLAAANDRPLPATVTGDGHKHGFQNTVVRVQHQYGAGVDDYLLGFYEKDDDTGRIAELFHTTAIHGVHKYSGDPSYRSVYADCTRLRNTIDQVGEWLSLSVTAYPELDDRVPVGFTTLADDGIGGVRIRARDIAIFFQPHRTGDPPTHPPTVRRDLPLPRSVIGFGPTLIDAQSHSSGGLHTNRRNEMPVKSHETSEYLNTQEDIVAYLNAAVEEMGDDPRLLMKAYRNVADARGGVSELARQAKMDWVALSRALSGQRIPRLDTLTKVSTACGIQLRFSASTFR